ncbi:MAG: hypothetical protein R3B09_15840 [Nannocystaceae bacterium]
MRRTPAEVAIRDELLRGPLDALCDRRGDPCWEGVLYAPQIPSEPSDAEVAAAIASRRCGVTDPERVRVTLRRWRLDSEGLLIRITAFTQPTLASWADAPFELDGERYGSLEGFYHALKLAEGDPRRREIAGATGPRATVLGRARRLHAASFVYRGQAIAVGSLAHEHLIARAALARVDAHRPLREALRATGAARLMIRDYAGPLGQVAPFALMLARLRLAQGGWLLPLRT